MISIYPMDIPLYPSSNYKVYLMSWLVYATETNMMVFFFYFLLAEIHKYIS